MGASSVTGVSGPGASGGKYKPDNSCGCGGCGKNEEEAVVSKKTYCATRYTATQGTTKYVVSNGSSRIKVCT